MDPNDPMQNLAISRCWFNLKTHLEKSLVSSQGVMQDTHQVELATFGSVLLNSQVWVLWQIFDSYHCPWKNMDCNRGKSRCKTTRFAINPFVYKNPTYADFWKCANLTIRNMVWWRSCFWTFHFCSLSSLCIVCHCCFWWWAGESRQRSDNSK